MSNPLTQSTCVGSDLEVTPPFLEIQPQNEPYIISDEVQIERYDNPAPGDVNNTVTDENGKYLAPNQTQNKTPARSWTEDIVTDSNGKQRYYFENASCCPGRPSTCPIPDTVRPVSEMIAPSQENGCEAADLIPGQGPCADTRTCPTGYLTESDQVKVFTEESSGNPVPSTPEPLSEQEVSFTIRMVLSELVELAQTVTETDEQAVQYLIDRVNTDVSHYERTTDQQQLVADQADAAVDAMYYMHNCFCKRGVNLSRIFQVVHTANTSKKDPKTGTYIRRESDGKVLKPEGWTPPDILKEIQRQTSEGSWA